MHRRLDTLIYIVSAVFLIGALSIWWQGVRPTGRQADLEEAGPIASQEDESAKVPDTALKEQPVLVVHVGGAVKSPGVYRLLEGQRVYEAVMLAEPQDDADLDLLNLAALLKDSQKIIVPRKGEPAVSGREPGSGSGSEVGQEPRTPSFPININTASASELESLPGIGPALAGAIVDYRNKCGSFEKAEDLQNVSGIGEKTFARISAYVVAE